VDRVRAGDACAEEELVVQFERRVWFALRRRLRDREASRELVNDVLMAVVRAVRDGRLRDAARLPGFVYGTARNVANNYVRGILARPAEEPLGAHLSIADPSAGPEPDERVAAVGRGLGRLDETAREIVLMTLLDGLKPGEIARRLGLTPEVVRARKSRAVRKLAAEAAGSGCLEDL
jgi:RNA polymerase sigma-70 factor (ECF subfamily)